MNIKFRIVVWAETIFFFLFEAYNPKLSLEMTLSKFYSRLINGVCVRVRVCI